MPRRFVGILEVDLVFGQRNLIGDPEKPALRFVVLVETRERVVIVTLDGNPASFVQKTSAAARWWAIAKNRGMKIDWYS